MLSLSTFLRLLHPMVNAFNYQIVPFKLNRGLRGPHIDLQMIKDFEDNLFTYDILKSFNACFLPSCFPT